jgi:hypothetical protein
MNDAARASGFNPLAWHCPTRGCFNTHCRPKIEVFHDIWPGKISMSDQDGTVEINWRFLVLEWKSSLGPIPRGQDIMFQRMSSVGGGGYFVVFCVVGNAETMEVTHYKIYWRGRDYGWVIGGLSDVRRRFSKWCAWALAQPSPSR